MKAFYILVLLNVTSAHHVHPLGPWVLGSRLFISSTLAPGSVASHLHFGVSVAPRQQSYHRLFYAAFPDCSLTAA
jgi:hypothetical protein